MANPDLLRLTFSSTTQLKTIGKVRGVARPVSIASLYATVAPGLMLVIVKDNVEAQKLKEELIALWGRTHEIAVFPDYETLPYDNLSAHQDLISRRLELLARLSGLNNAVIIATLPSLLQRLPPLSYLGATALYLKTGQQVDVKALRQRFADAGYLQVEQVLSHGEFAVRGELLDIFPMGSDTPYRIDFFDDEIESIAKINVETQRSEGKIPELKLLPAHEFPLDKDGIAVFRSHYRDAFKSAGLQNHVIYQAISRGAIPAGIEYYLPLLFASLSTLFDYLPEKTPVITTFDEEAEAHAFDTMAHHRASSLEGNADHPPLPVYTLFLSPAELMSRLKERQHVRLMEEPLDEETLKKRLCSNLNVSPVPDIALDVRGTEEGGGKFTAFVTDFIEKGGRILMTAISEGRRQSLREILPSALKARYSPVPASSYAEFLTSDAPLMLSLSPFDGGVIFDKEKLCLLTETEILGFQVVRQRQRRRTRQISADAIVENLSQLTPGDPVVHIDHGVGRYLGLKVLTMNGIQGEYLTIEYQDGDILNIPITALNKVARYSGSDNPPLSKLGSDNWGKRKHNAAQKVRDVAAELLDLNSRRLSREGVKFEIDETALDAFASHFGYETTPDQQAAIDATLQDMSRGAPMDRLICGDVGFGKTEVALRAAFVAAHDGYQVAILVPTTVLAEQHYQNFKERFASTAINVDVLSRFKSAAEQTKALKALEAGQIDIIIGTHKLLSRTVKFRRLGLVIVDEEHRFGVRQKERLKELRAEVDILTLTATPIPRTLNMAMEGLRELSVIATAPEHRLAVRTFVHEDSAELTREAIMRELRRGGQIYYLHNDVATIEHKREELAALVPEARIGIGHGQMGERELQKVMRDFYHQRFNLLLCSTIIENGLDVPSANTIIIDRADRLGLAQLHQLRGRVGRSHHQAYAYLFTPKERQLTKNARLRLEAIASMEELGSGFILATHDLEIRGAGELLGEEQSGQIESVGFSLYMDMLEAAVKALKEGREPSLNELTLNSCDIDLHLPSLLPDDYIGDIGVRLSFYKRLSSCTTPEAFGDLKSELIDRYGTLPEGAENLFQISWLKTLAQGLGITRIAGDGEGGIIEFGAHSTVDSRYLVTLITQCRHGEYVMRSPTTLRYNLKEDETTGRITLLKRLLLALNAHRTDVPEEHP